MDAPTFNLQRWPSPLGIYGLNLFTEHACHYEVNDTVGYIEYDENDVYHQPVVSCTWTIQAGENKVIQLYLTYLDIPSKKQCTDNYLEVKNKFQLIQYADAEKFQTKLYPFSASTSVCSLKLSHSMTVHTSVLCKNLFYKHFTNMSNWFVMHLGYFPTAFEI